jgi:hypothetical protein
MPREGTVQRWNKELASKLLKKTHRLRCAQSPRCNVLQVRLRSSIFRAPRLWIFLSSLQEAFFSSLLNYAKHRRRPPAAIVISEK